jgi:hypothetical protein
MTNMKIKRLSSKPFVRKVIGIMLTIPAVLLVCALILVGVLQVYSPGKIEPFQMKTESRWREAFRRKYLSTSTVWSRGYLS